MECGLRPNRLAMALTLMIPTSFRSATFSSSVHGLNGWKLFMPRVRAWLNGAVRGTRNAVQSLVISAVSSRRLVDLR